MAVVNDDEFAAVLRKLRRELMGSMVGHMSDDELERWMRAWERDDPRQEFRGLPAWLVKRRDEARVALLRVLKERAWCMRLARALLEAQGLAR